MSTHNDGTTLGDFFRRGRQHAGLTLEQISAETKIPVRHLQALEAENLEVLPGAFYQRAEVRAYARSVGLDPNLALAHLDRLLQPPPPAIAHEPERMRLPVASPRKIAALIGVVAVSLVLGLITAGKKGSVVTPPHEGSVPTTTDARSEGVDTPDFVPESAVKTSGEAEASTVVAVPTRETQLVIVSEPAGARVTVDGIGWGDTPVTVRNLPPGAKRIRVTKAGYVSEDRVAQLTDERPTTLQISLQTTPD